MSERRTGTALRDESGYYVIPSTGERLPSVSTILSWAKGGVAAADRYWVAQRATELVAAAYRKEMVTDWSETKLEDGRVIYTRDQIDPRELLRDVHRLANHALFRLRQAADKGTLLHRCLSDRAVGMQVDIQQLPEYLSGLVKDLDLCVVADDALPYARSLWAWLDHFSPGISLPETTVYSSRGYAGTFDAIFHMPDGRRYVADLKTSSQTDVWHGLQLSAYRHAGRIVLEDGSEAKMPRTDGAAVLKISPTNAMWRPVPDSRRSYQAFLRVLRAWREHGELGAMGKCREFSLTKAQLGISDEAQAMPRELEEVFA